MLFEDEYKLLYTSLQLLDMTRKRDRKVTKAFVSILVEENKFEEVFTKFFKKELETASKLHNPTLFRYELLNSIISIKYWHIKRLNTMFTSAY